MMQDRALWGFAGFFPLLLCLFESVHTESIFKRFLLRNSGVRKRRKHSPSKQAGGRAPAFACRRSCLPGATCFETGDPAGSDKWAQR